MDKSILGCLPSLCSWWVAITTVILAAGCGIPTYKYELEPELAKYNHGIEIATVLVLVGILGESLVEYMLKGVLKMHLGTVFVAMLAAGVCGELIGGLKVTEISEAIQRNADQEISVAKAEIADTRLTTIRLAPYAVTRVIATKEMAEGGDDSSLEPLKKFAGMQAIIESSPEEDAPSAAESLRKVLIDAGWKPIKPVHRLKPIPDGITVQPSWGSEDAARAILRLVTQNGWPAVTPDFSAARGTNSPFGSLPPHTVRIVIGAKPPALFLNPLVKGWEKSFYEMLNRQAAEKGKVAMEAQKEAEDEGRKKKRKWRPSWWPF
jgi:hypothetical protein